MADDINKDLDPEEENNDAFEDDDFGLPDLEYDELDDDEFEDEFGTPEFEESSDDTSEFDEGEIDSEEIDETLTVDDDAFGDLDEELEVEEMSADDTASFDEELTDDFSSDELDDVGDLDDIGDLDDELDSSEFDLSEEELQKELEELESEELDFSDIEDVDSGETSEDEFYEQESFEEFSDDNVLDSVFGDDDEDPAVKEEQVLVSTTAGTPGSGPQRDVSAKQAAANQYAQAYAESQNEKGKFARIVIIGTVVILAVAFGLYFTFSGDGDQEIAKTEQVTPKPQPKPQPKEEAPKEEVKETPQPTPKPAATPTAAPAGTVNELQSRTGKAYIIIASFVDGDLAKDHADQIAADGKSPYVIPPFNNGLYYRVAIAEFQTFADASQNINRYKEEFGQDIWTLRY